MLPLFIGDINQDSLGKWMLRRVSLRRVQMDSLLLSRQVKLNATD
jgi:hypothetical protein